MRRGFTLVEISVVLMIIAVIIGGAFATLTGSVKQAAYNSTVATMDAIDKALVDYSVATNRLPCPSSLTTIVTSANYGVEAANMGSCTGGSPAANNSSSGVVEGGVPTRTLRLPDSYMFDGWGHRIRYAVDTTYTNATGSNIHLPPPASGLCYPSQSSITIKDDTTAVTPRSSVAVYALISHGANGHGAYTASSSTMFNAGSTNLNEQKNCHCTSTGAAGSYDNIYIQHAPTYTSGGSLLTAFDDIVTYRENWQLRTANTKYLPFACMMAIDYNQYRGTTCGSVNNDTTPLLIYYTTTQKWTSVSAATIGLPASGTGCIYDTGVAADSLGNIYVSAWTTGVNSSGGTIYKYTRSTNSWASWLSGQAGPASVYIDSSNNVLVPYDGGNNVIKYNSSAAVLGTYTNATHAMNGPQTAMLDKSNNLWVANCGGSYPIMEGTPAGYTVWATTGVGVNSSCGSPGAGTFWCPQGMYVDSNYMWVGDYNNHRVQRCSLSSDCTNTLNWTSYGSTCTAGTTPPGYFYFPMAITGDFAGNVYVGDCKNRRIQMWDGSKWSVFAFLNTMTTSIYYCPSGIAVVGTPPFINIAR